MSITRNIAWGFRCGLWFAAAYMVIAVVGYLTVSREVVERRGISFPVVLLTYAIVGPISGAIVGLLRPLARARVGAMIVGVIAAVPVMTGLMIAFRGLPSSWSDPTEVLAIGLAAVVGGAATGYTLWEPWSPELDE